MTRDIDLCLKILRDIEQVPAGESCRNVGSPENPIDPNLVQHIEILIEADLLEGTAHAVPLSRGGGHYLIQRLTWKGHDFLEAARDQTVWEKSKARLKAAGAWTFSLALEVLKEEAKQRLFGP